MADAFGLDRIDAIDHGNPVIVSLFELLDQHDRNGLDPLTRCTLNSDRSLTERR
jgi:hypothetical protein